MQHFYFIIIATLASNCFSQTYDLSFNGTGTISFNDTYEGIGQIESPSDIIYDEAIGKIIMLNQFNGEGAMVHRFNADGTHDTGFGTDGKVELYINQIEGFANIFADDDGYRLTGFSNSDPDRWSPFNEDLNADGNINTSFGDGDGIISVPEIERMFTEASCKTSDGKYFLVGNLNSVGNYGAPIMSFNADGTYNTEFGFYSLEINELNNFEDVAELPDGRIIAIGETHNNFEAYFPIIACFLPTGGLDLSFGVDGVVMPEMPLPHLSNSFLSVATDEDGNIFIGGDVRLDPAVDGFKVYIAKFDSDGNQIMDFGNDGYAYTVTTFFCDVPRILVSPAGNIYGLSSGHLEADATQISHIFKFLPDGTVDATFTNGEPGLFKIQPNGTDTYDDVEGKDMLMQADGKLVVLGQTDGFSLNDDFWITRITTNETPVDAIEENKSETIISVFPNPATDYIKIESSSIIQSIEIISIDGTVLEQKDVNQEWLHLNIGQYSAGIYLMRVKDIFGNSSKNIFVKQ